MLKNMLWACVAAVALSDVSAQAVIIVGAGTDVADPGRNKTAPTGILANSGWALQGDFNGFLGTPVSGTYFLTAAHFGGGTAGNVIVMPDGSSHTLTGNSTPITGTDLVLRQVSSATPFTSFATLYDSTVDGALLGTDTLVDFGRGTARGAAVSGKGWQWGAYDGAHSWGTNNSEGLTSVSGFPAATQFIAADFDQTTGGSNEGTLSNGDSGGGLFVQRGGVWKLVGINYGVDVYRTTSDGSGTPIAAYDATGLYVDNGNGTYTLNGGPSPQPETWVASYVAQPSSLATIRATVPEPAMLGVFAVGAAGLMRRRSRA